MNKSESIKELATALSAFQGEIKNVVKEGKNPFFKSRYATLDGIWDEVRPILAKHGLAFSQFPTGDNELESHVLHSSGEWVSATTKMYPKDNTPQSHGSAITYTRRYAMCSILGVATEDDDGNAAQPAPSQVRTPPHA